MSLDLWPNSKEPINTKHIKFRNMSSKCRKRGASHENDKRRQKACLPEPRVKRCSPEIPGLNFVSALDISCKLLHLLGGALKLSQDQVGTIFGV